MRAFGYEITEANARQAVSTRRASITTYVAALDQIASTHADVVKAIESDKLDDVVGVISAFVTTYSAKIAALKKTFP